MNVRHIVSNCMVVLGVLTFLGPNACCADQQVRLLGIVEIAADFEDRSGLGTTLENGRSAARFGGISGIEYLGNDEYLLLPDRGPMDGACNYACRFHRMRIRYDANENQLSYKLVATTMLQNEHGEALSGLAKIDHASGLRLDPEAIRVLDKQLLISDEYGPDIRSFDFNGVQTGQWSIPKAFKPNTYDYCDESKVTFGRQDNGGFEGLAVSADGKQIFAALQKPLVQDLVEDASDGSKPIDDGGYCRFLRFDSEGNANGQFLYKLEAKKCGISEIVVLDSQTLLCLERDSKKDLAASIKRLYRITISESSNSIDRIDETAQNLLASQPAMDKQLFVDLLDPNLGIAADKIAAKIEGVCFGPKLESGEQILLIATDNDFADEQPSRIYALAVSGATL